MVIMVPGQGFRRSGRCSQSKKLFRIQNGQMRSQEFALVRAYSRRMHWQPMKLQDQNHLQKIPCCKVRDYGFSMLQCDVKSKASASNAYNLLEGLFIDHRSGYPLTWRRWELLSNQVENQENELPESEIMMAHIEKDGFSRYIRDKDLSPIENS